jgi:polyhydroxybutyrate depolymerase
VGAQQREFLLHAPAAGPTDKPAPLVVDLHGLGTGAALQSAISAWSTLADREGIVVVYPQGTNNLWSFAPDDANPDIPFVRAVVTTVQAERCIDLSRTYVSGFSMGGLLAAAMACKAPTMFAAFGFVAGMQSPSKCASMPPRPAIVFWGSADCVLPYFGATGPCLAIGPPGRTQPTAPVPEGPDNPFAPVDQVISEWAEHGGCAPGGESEQVSASVTRRTYRACRNGADVVFYFVEGGGHTWPGSRLLMGQDPAGILGYTSVTTDEIDATTLIWSFFRAHQLAA